MYPDTEPFVPGYKCGKWKAGIRYNYILPIFFIYHAWKVCKM